MSRWRINNQKYMKTRKWAISSYPMSLRCAVWKWIVDHADVWSANILWNWRVFLLTFQRDEETIENIMLLSFPFKRQSKQCLHSSRFTWSIFLHDRKDSGVTALIQIHMIFHAIIRIYLVRYNYKYSGFYDLLRIPIKLSFKKACIINRKVFFFYNCIIIASIVREVALWFAERPG